MENTLPLLSHNDGISPFEDATPIGQGCSLAQTTFNLLNFMIGVGILTTPYTIEEAGWIALAILGVFVVLCCYTGILIMKCIEANHGVHLYPDIGQAAYGIYGRFAISAIWYAELFFYSVTLIILEAETLAVLFPETSLKVGSVPLDTVQVMGIVSGVIVLPTLFIKDFKILSTLSAIGIASIAIISLCLVALTATEGISRPEAHFVKWNGVPFAVGVYGFSTNAHSFIPTIYQSMDNKRQFPKALVKSFFLCGLALGGFAAFGYLTFGAKTMQQITWNMPQQNLASKVAMLSMVINPVSKYPFSAAPLIRCVEERLPYQTPQSNCRYILIKLAFVALTVVFAVFVPYFGLAISLMGNSVCICLSVIIPSLCYMKLVKKTHLAQKIICLIIVMFGVVCATAGTYDAVSKLII